MPSATKTPAPKPSKPKTETSNKALILRHMAPKVDDLPDNLGLAISEAQLAILTQKTNPSYIRKRKGRGGKELSYVDHAYVTERLNLAFGWAWNFTILHQGLYEAGGKPFEAWCHGRLEVTTGNGTITKEQFGCQPIEFLQSSNQIPVSLGDALKGAASDCLKKCASLLGLALDLYDSDGDVAGERFQAQGEATPKAETSPATKATAAPTGAAAAPATKSAAEAPPSVPSPEPTPQATEVVHKTTNGHVLDADGTYHEGALRYKLDQNVTKVWIERGGKGNWVAAGLPLPKFLSSKQLLGLVEKITAETFGGNTFERDGHLKKHFKVGTIAALTGEQLAALIEAQERDNPDPRWYADRINPQETTAPARPSAPQVRQAMLAHEYGISDTERQTAAAVDFLEAVAGMADPLYLKEVLWPKGWKWEGERRDELVQLAKGLREGIFSPEDVDLMTHEN